MEAYIGMRPVCLNKSSKGDQCERRDVQLDNAMEGMGLEGFIRTRAKDFAIIEGELYHTRQIVLTDLTDVELYQKGGRYPPPPPPPMEQCTVAKV